MRARAGESPRRAAIPPAAGWHRAARTGSGGASYWQARERIRAMQRWGSRGLERPQQTAAQRMRPRLGDRDIDEALQQRARSRKVDPAVVFGAAGEFPLTLLRATLDQHALHAADHAAADCPRLRIELGLQGGEPLLLDQHWPRIRQRGSRRAGPAAVEKTE